MPAPSTVGIVGAGTMGSGLAQLCVQRGLDVFLFDAIPAAWEGGVARVAAGLKAAVEKGRLQPAEAEAGLRRLSQATSLESFAVVDVVLEAAPEDLALKQRLFEELGRLVPAPAVLASNTSSLLIRDVASRVQDPARAVGLHFFNPPVAMKLVEVARAEATSEAAFRRAWELVLALGKTPVAVRDVPGFIVNRVVRPLYIESQRIAGEGHGRFSAVDAAVKELGGLPMGPFELMDLIGLDVNLAISKSIYAALGSPSRLQPHFIQERLVAGGELGRKSGRGFYLYENGRRAAENPAALQLLPEGQTNRKPRTLWERVMGAVADEARRAEEEGVAAGPDIDTAVKLAMNFPRGPLEWRRHAAKA